MPFVSTQETSFLSSSPEHTRAIAKDLAKQVPFGTVICLEGDLGAGKTTFSKAFIASITGVEEDAIQSPTFIYLNSYEAHQGSLHHFDLYRLKNSDEFVELGFLDYVSQDSLCLIEWPCRLQSLLKSYLLVSMDYVSEHERKIQICFKEGGSCL